MRLNTNFIDGLRQLNNFLAGKIDFAQDGVAVKGGIKPEGTKDVVGFNFSFTNEGGIEAELKTETGSFFSLTVDPERVNRAAEKIASIFKGGK